MESVRDIVIGMSDDLTVPFALATGFSEGVESSGIIITAGLAEVGVGTIAMRLGGYSLIRISGTPLMKGRVQESRML